MATVNSLGLGSGVLTSDIIDKLRKADNANILDPLTKKISLANKKEDSYSLLSSLMDTFKSSTSALSNDSLYLGRSVSGNSDAVTVKADAGSDIQSFKLSNISLAKKDIWESQTHVSATNKAIASLGSGTLSVAIGDKKVDINYDSTTTMDDIKNAINDNVGSVMTASTLPVGTDSYSLTVSADNTNQAITFTDTNNNSDGLKSILNLNNIQVQKEATFDYNGISISRPTNEISDLMSGVTITLNANQIANESANINISQDSSSISSDLSTFVDNFNKLNSNLKSMTNSDPKASSGVGAFKGDTFVKSISEDIKTLILNQDSNGNSLVDYGISVDKTGVMSFDSSVFKSKYAENPTVMQNFFDGTSTSDGIFKQLDTKMKGYTGSGKLLSDFSDQLTSSKKLLTDQYDKQKASLDARYNTMTKKFAAYDAMMSKLTNSFSSLQMIINTSQARS